MYEINLSSILIDAEHFSCSVGMLGTPTNTRKKFPMDINNQPTLLLFKAFLDIERSGGKVNITKIHFWVFLFTQVYLTNKIKINKHCEASSW